MKLLLFTCAESYAVDQRSNVVSIFNIVEHIAPVAFPCVITDIHLIAIVRREEQDPELALRLMVRFNRDLLMDVPFEVGFSNGNLARALGRVGDLTVAEPGKLIFALQRGKRTWGDWTIDVLGSPTFEEALPSGLLDADTSGSIRRKPRTRTGSRVVN